MSIWSKILWEKCIRFEMTISSSSLLHIVSKFSLFLHYVCTISIKTLSNEFWYFTTHRRDHGIPGYGQSISLGVIKKLCWQDFGFFFDHVSAPGWHFSIMFLNLLKENLHFIDITPTTYLLKMFYSIRFLLEIYMELDFDFIFY